MSVAFVGTSTKKTNMVHSKISTKIGRARIAVQKLTCLKRNKLNNGSKLLGKGILDGGAIPPSSTIRGLYERSGS